VNEGDRRRKGKNIMTTLKEHILNYAEKRKIKEKMRALCMDAEST
jgi:hypothetical protein